MSDDVRKVHEVLHRFSEAMLVTHRSEGEGDVHIRPMAIAKLEDDCRLWFFTSKDSSKAAEVGRDAHVHVVCQGSSTFATVRGRASLVSDRAKIDELWREPFRAWFRDGKSDPDIALVCVEPEEVEYWDSRGTNRLKYLFQVARAYAKHETPKIDREQHGTVRL